MCASGAQSSGEVKEVLYMSTVIVGRQYVMLETSYWFEEINVGDKLLRASPPLAMETSLDLLLEARLNQQHKTHLVAVPRLMTFLWINNMGKE